MIRRSDRVAEVLRRDERLLETLVAASPVFERLRSPLMRRTMARLATVEQVARMAGLDPDVLAARLNAALAGAPEPSEPASPETGAVMTTMHPEAPARLAAVPPELVVELDVREDLRSGREPFSRIMAARQALPPGGALRLRAIFEPVPLYAVMAKQGFDHWTEELAADDWRVWFYPKQAEAEAPVVESSPAPASGATEPSSGDGDEVIVLDVRGMEPPEPMVRTLAALEGLPPGKTLMQINERVPQFLLPKLEELGFTYQLREQNEALIRVFIRRRDNT